MIENVSFVVIARNEAFAVDNCLASIAAMPLENCEVVCVDSDSADGTLDVMKGYAGKIENLTVVQCSGHVNAAVARNVGMRYCTGREYVFFVDGDVELYPEFITEALDRIQSGKADAVTGKLLEIQYSPGYATEIRQLVRRKHMTREERCLMTGGIFLARRRVVESVGDWDDEFVRLQDFDYTLRISRFGLLLQLPLFIGVHHSLEYHDRSWDHFKKGYLLLYGRLLRKNLDKPEFLLFLLRANRGLVTFLMLGLILLVTLTAASLSLLPLSAVACVAVICAILDYVYSSLVKHQKFSQWILHNCLGPPMILCGLCLRPRRSGERATHIACHNHPSA
jgi:glycosyltransferase involved in cell wall biosynthesis